METGFVGLLGVIQIPFADGPLSVVRGRRFVWGGNLKVAADFPGLSW